MQQSILPVGGTDFFREVTLRICGKLEIEQALCDTLAYVREIMPADQLVLAVYDRGLGSLRIVATAQETGGRLQASDLRKRDNIKFS